MPVLALAIVVEARAIIAKWDTQDHRTFKGLQGLIWAFPLAVYALALPRCFIALAGSPVDPKWITIIQFGIAAGAGSLILNPAIEILVRSNVRALAHLFRFSSSPSLMAEYLALRWSMRRIKARLARVSSQLEWREIQLRSARHGINTGSTPVKNETEWMENIKLVLQGLQARRLDVQKAIDEVANASRRAASAGRVTIDELEKELSVADFYALGRRKNGDSELLG